MTISGISRHLCQRPRRRVTPSLVAKQRLSLPRLSLTKAQIALGRIAMIDGTGTRTLEVFQRLRLYFWMWTGLAQNRRRSCEGPGRHILKIFAVRSRRKKRTGSTL